MTPEDQARADQIRARADAATRPPWSVPDDATFHDAPIMTPRGYLCTSPDDGVRGSHDWPDAQFIAAARSDVPWLLDRLAAATAEVERLRERIGDYENCITWDVTCTGCAAHLDNAIAEHERADRANDALAAATERADRAEARHAVLRSALSVLHAWPDGVTGKRMVDAEDILTLLEADRTKAATG